MYDDPEDRAVVVETAELIIASGRNIRQDLRGINAPPPGRESQQSGQHAPSNQGYGILSNDISMCLKDSDNIFAGHFGESWMEHVDEYLQVSRDYNVMPQQKLHFLHSLLSKDAKRLYL